MDLRASDVLSAVLAGSRCPACAAAVRPGAPWCTLCYHDLRPAPRETVTPPVPPAPVTPPTTSAPVPPPTALVPLALLTPPTTPTPAAAPGAASWPCSACGQANPYSVSACAACGTGFLAGLRETEGPLLELPVVGDLTALSRGRRLGLAAGVVLAVIALTVIVSLLFG